MSLALIQFREELAAFLDDARRQGRQVSVVPTMGALHRGHQALISEAARHGEEVLVTIFVNPTQFGPGEDFERYPRRLEQDMELAQAAGATSIFAPGREELYPPPDQTRVVPGELAAPLCGASRPGHFTGVLTVVAKFMNLLAPATFIFGKKDFQQLRLIQAMVRDLFFPVTIVEHPIVREDDGLALSSRNAYLSPAQRVQALAIPRALAMASTWFHSFPIAGREELRDAPKGPSELIANVKALLQDAGLRVDYVELVDSSTLRPYPALASSAPPLLAVAAFAGSTRLIDNLILGRDTPPEVP